MHLTRARIWLCCFTASLLCLPSSAKTQSPSESGPPSMRDTVTREYRGAYQRGFEQSWFSPCDAPRDDTLWWVTLTDQALRQRDSLLATIKSPAVNGLVVRWRGTISQRMPSGHMGRGTRYMLVTSILEVRPMPEEGACVRV